MGSYSVLVESKSPRTQSRPVLFGIENVCQIKGEESEKWKTYVMINAVVVD